MPASAAASTSDRPLGTVISRPLMESVTVDVSTVAISPRPPRASSLVVAQRLGQRDLLSASASSSSSGTTASGSSPGSSRRRARMKASRNGHPTPRRVVVVDARTGWSRRTGSRPRRCAAGTRRGSGSTNAAPASPWRRPAGTGSCPGCGRTTFSSRSSSSWRASPISMRAEDLLAPARALAARRALAAALVDVELGDAQRQLDDAGAVVDRRHGARAGHRAGRGDRLVVESGVDLVGQQDRRGGAAGDDRLERAAVRHAAAVALDQVAQRRRSAAARSCPGA